MYFAMSTICVHNILLMLLDIRRAKQLNMWTMYWLYIQMIYIHWISLRFIFFSAHLLRKDFPN